MIAIIAVGVCLGFLPFNWHPSKIIMGDAGALLLGLLLAVPTITIGGRTDHAFSGKHEQREYTSTLLNWLTEMIVGGRQSAAKQRLEMHRQAQVDAA